jgi:ABC-2 type transport system permease protein
MAVYKRTYKSYSGPLTPQWARWMIIPRYAWSSIFKTRLLTILYVVCFFYPLGAALAIYFNHNVSFLKQYIPVPPGGLLKIENMFFFVFNSVQSTLAFILTALVGPGLISPDLTNNALPLYFCRPLSRTEYIVGKGMVIAALLSFITWIPGLALFALQASLADSAWWDANAYLGWSIFVSGVLWIVLITVMAMALSAWVRWKIIAGSLMLVIFFVGAALGEMIRQIGRSDFGAYFDIGNNMGRVWLYLYRVKTTHPMTLEESVAVLIAFSAFFIYLLVRKVKAFEVVRG